MRFNVESRFDRLHDIGLLSCRFQSVFHLKSQKRYEAYLTGAFSCREEANLVLNQSDMK